MQGEMMAADIRSNRPRHFEGMARSIRGSVTMQELKQHTTFLRERVVLPEGISIFGETFCEGWTLLKSEEASWLDSGIRKAGWNSFVLTKEHWRSGFGLYSQDALQKTVRVALRQIGRNHNAAEIEQIKVTKISMVLSREDQHSGGPDPEKSLFRHGRRTFGAARTAGVGSETATVTK